MRAYLLTLRDDFAAEPWATMWLCTLIGIDAYLIYVQGFGHC